MLLMILAAFSGCSLLPVRHDTKGAELVSQSVWAVYDSINAGRFDLADEYSGQSVRLVPAPKNRIPIQPINRLRKTKAKKSSAEING